MYLLLTQATFGVLVATMIIGGILPTLAWAGLGGLMADLFGAEQWSAPMTEDVPFYVELARETEGPLVELAVGNGRVAIQVARETGRRRVP